MKKEKQDSNSHNFILIFNKHLFPTQVSLFSAHKTCLWDMRCISLQNMMNC